MNKKNPIVTIGEEESKTKEKDEFFVGVAVKHLIETQEESITILEIAFGYFDKEDIVRLEDKYNQQKFRSF